MWLLNVVTRKLEYYEGSHIPAYAILSHRWGDEEVSFAELNTSPAGGKSKSGWEKIELCCKQALVEGLNHLWVDTCCIDKRSSAELSEAINSMFRWYQDAAVCYVFLGDVKHTDTDVLQESVWFYRCWTLQELLAPRFVQFYNADWVYLGSRGDLESTIADVTGIPPRALSSFQRDAYSVADKMSWAARREATRKEDIAYSLLGIFDVSMSMIYGEGERAFSRLQEAIMKQSEDLTIFAWRNLQPEEDKACLLAPSPSFFEYDRKYCKTWSIYELAAMDNIDLGLGLVTSQGDSFSAAGLSIDLCMWPCVQDIYFVPLCIVCKQLTKQRSKKSLAGMLIERSRQSGYFWRVFLDGQGLFYQTSDQPVNGSMRRIVLTNGWLNKTRESLSGDNYGIEVAKIGIDNSQNAHADLFSRHSVIGRPRQLSLPIWTVGIAGFIRIKLTGSDVILLHLGFDSEFNTFCLITRPVRKPDSLAHTGILNTGILSLSVPRVGFESISVYNQSDMMSLVNLLRSERLSDWKLDRDRVALCIFPWQQRQAVYSVDGLGRVEFSRYLLSKGSTCPLNVSIDVWPHQDGSSRVSGQSRDATDQELKWDWYHQTSN